MVSAFLCFCVCYPYIVTNEANSNPFSLYVLNLWLCTVMSSSEDFAVKLAKDSDLYREVVYALKMGLGGHPCSDIHVWSIENPTATVQFERRTSNMLTLPCWVDCGALNGSNQMDDVVRRGFVFPADGSGMSFHHGNIKLDDSNEQFVDDAPESTSGKQQHFYIFNDVGIGRPYIIDDTAQRQKPEGYDSLYVSNKHLDRDDDGFISAEEYEAIAAGDGNPATYEHEYIITDPTQVLPRFVIRFCADLDSTAEDDSLDPLKVYDRYDFFDPVLYRPVSLRDKMVGSHSMGEAANHKLVSMADAYNAAMVESKKQDPLIAQKKKQIMEELNKIDDKLRSINLNYATVEEQLYSMLKKSLFTLKEEVNCKTKILLSTELEFRRQLEQLDNAENWLEREQSELSQTDFLQAWKLHTQLTSKMCQQVSAETAILDNLNANLSIKGGVEIVTQDGTPLMSERGMNASEFSKATLGQGSTELRQQLFADANAGASTVTGNTKRNLVSASAADLLTSAVKSNSTASSTAPHQTPQTSGIGGISYNPPNYLASTDNKMMDNQTWTESLEKSMGVGVGTPAQSNRIQDHRQSTLYTPQPPTTPQNLMPPSPININNYQPARVMQQVASHFQQFSLTQLAERKMRQLNVSPNEQMVFRGSAIVGPNDAKKLYYSIPFISNLPTTSLVYSTRMHERSIRVLQQSVMNVLSPTMVIIRSGEYIFGGYATDQWKFDGSRGGNPKGFLFSVTLDMKIPYHGRQKDSQSGVMGGSSGHRHDCMWSGADFMSFGIKDLCLRGDFRMCTSEVEYSYSVGVDLGSIEAKSHLPGSNVFVADEIEVWSEST